MVRRSSRLLSQARGIGTAGVVGSGRAGRLRPAGLPLVGIKLRLGQTGRHFRIQPIRDGLEVEILLIIDFETQIEIESLRVVVAVPE